MAEWLPIDDDTPRDGTEILAYCSIGETPFIVYWGCVGRFNNTPKMWVGNSDGALQDSDIAGWMSLPDTGEWLPSVFILPTPGVTAPIEED